MRRFAAIISAAVLLCLPSACPINAASDAGRMLLPGGMPFGVKLFTEGVLISDVGEVKCGNTVLAPARDAGIRKNDIILSVNGSAVCEACQVSGIVSESGGKTLAIAVKRGDEELMFSVTPVVGDDGSYRMGLTVRDGAAGIGTVTYIEPETGRFAGLGHGICDPESGEPASLTRGAVTGAKIEGVVKGKSGEPGELVGYFSSGKKGVVTANTECGVYGVLCEIPDGLFSEPVCTAEAGEVREGEALILCTTGEDGIGKYTVRISDIVKNGQKTKNFTVTVTDPALLARTGGIVQGMSGSPIIQNGKLIGAVTHVLVNDPAKGYGIFIENMLEAAQSSK